MSWYGEHLFCPHTSFHHHVVLWKMTLARADSWRGIWFRLGQNTDYLTHSVFFFRTSITRSGKERESLMVKGRMWELGARHSHAFCHMMEFNLLWGQKKWRQHPLVGERNRSPPLSRLCFPCSWGVGVCLPCSWLTCSSLSLISGLFQQIPLFHQIILSCFCHWAYIVNCIIVTNFLFSPWIN